jgi:O-antigen/teichoic acid export membrane protein
MSGVLEDPPRRPGSFLRASSLTFGGTVVNVVLGLALSALTARVLGPRGKGIFVLALLLPNLISLLSDLGMSVSVVYFVAQRRYRLSLLAGNNIVIGAVLATLGILAGVAVVTAGGHQIFPGVPTTYVLVGLLMLPALDVGPLLQNLLVGQQRFVTFNIAAVAATVVGALPMLFALLVLHTGPFGLIVAQTLGTTVFVLGLALWLRTELGSLELRPRWSYWREGLSYGGRAHVGNVLGYANLRADTWLIGIMLNPAAVGIYSVGVALMERLLLISNPLSQVLFPRIAADSDGQSHEITPLLLRAVLAVTSVGAIVLVLLAPEIVRLLFSARFLSVVSSMRFLSVGVVALAGSNLLMGDLSGRGRPEISGYVGSIGAATNIALNILWLPRFGITGAGMASAVSYSVTFATCVFFYCRVSKTSLRGLLVPSRSDTRVYGQAFRVLAHRARRADEVGETATGPEGAVHVPPDDGNN